MGKLLAAATALVLCAGFAGCGTRAEPMPAEERGRVSPAPGSGAAVPTEARTAASKAAPAATAPPAVPSPALENAASPGDEGDVFAPVPGEEHGPARTEINVSDGFLVLDRDRRERISQIGMENVALAVDVLLGMQYEWDEDRGQGTIRPYRPEDALADDQHSFLYGVAWQGYPYGMESQCAWVPREDLDQWLALAFGDHADWQGIRDLHRREPGWNGTLSEEGMAAGDSDGPMWESVYIGPITPLFHPGDAHLFYFYAYLDGALCTGRARVQLGEHSGGGPYIQALDVTDLEWWSAEDELPREDYPDNPWQPPLCLRPR